MIIKWKLADVEGTAITSIYKFYGYVCGKKQFGVVGDPRGGHFSLWNFDSLDPTCVLELDERGTKFPLACLLVLAEDLIPDLAKLGAVKDMKPAERVIRWEPNEDDEDEGVYSFFDLKGNVNRNLYFDITKKDREDSSRSLRLIVYSASGKTRQIDTIAYDNSEDSIENLSERAEDFVPDLVKLASLKDGKP